MAVIDIRNFGGELPSVSPRALPPDSSQVNKNLYLATTEFRPLSQDTVVGSAAAGTKSMHKFARTASGDIDHSPSSGWKMSSDLRSYAKGQINDERTERTYVSFDDGSARPRIIDVNGSDRLLGVPRPVKPSVTANVTDELTAEEADAYLFGEVTAEMKTAIAESLATEDPDARDYDCFSGGFYGLLKSSEVPAGPMTDDYWNLWGVVVADSAIGKAIDRKLVSCNQTGSNLYIGLPVLPYTRFVNIETLKSKLKAIKEPVPPEEGEDQLLSDSVIDAMIGDINGFLNPSVYAQSVRDDRISIAKEFSSLLSLTISAVTTAPTAPTKPTVPEYSYATSTPVRSSAWVAYDALLATYNTNLKAYNESKSTASLDTSSLNSKLIELQNKGTSALAQQNSLTNNRTTSITGIGSGTSDLLIDYGGVSEIIGETIERIIDTRFYIVTYVTDWGEESEPSPPSDMLEVDQNDSVTIDIPPPPSGRNIEKWRLYRSNVGSTTAAFQFVEEDEVGTANYEDKKKSAELGEVCPTVTWSEPPYRMAAQPEEYPPPAVGSNPYLRGLINMPNGVMAGFFDNTVAFCDPYHPYAWPVEYQISIEYPVVGLGVFGQTLFVCTAGNPYFIYGADSATMTAQKMDNNQSCASSRTIIAARGGVIYASPDGLCFGNQQDVVVITAGLFTREDWQKLQPETMFAAEHENIYYLFYTGDGGGCLSFDTTAKKLGRLDLTATAAFTDKLNDVLYVASGGSLKAAFGSASRRSATWKTGKMMMEKQAPLAWLNVQGDQSASDAAVVKWIGDGELRYVATVQSNTPVRLPAGRWIEHEIEVASAARITRVTLASTTQELQAL